MTQKADAAMSQMKETAEALSKWIALILAVSYGCGFVIVQSWSYETGVADYSILDAAFIAAGLIFLFINAFCGAGLISWAGIAYVRWSSDPPEGKAAKSIRTVSSGKFFAASCLLIVLSFVLYVLLLILLDWLLGKFQAQEPLHVDFTWRRAWVFTNFAAFVVLIYGGLRRFLTDTGILWSALSVLLLLFSLVFFGIGIYGTIPPQIGGGAPTAVQLIVKSDKAPILKALGVPLAETAGQPGKAADEEGMLLSGNVLLVGAHADRFTFCVSRCRGVNPEILILGKGEVVGFVRQR